MPADKRRVRPRIALVCVWGINFFVRSRGGRTLQNQCGQNQGYRPAQRARRKDGCVSSVAVDVRPSQVVRESTGISGLEAGEFKTVQGGRWRWKATILFCQESSSAAFKSKRIRTWSWEREATWRLGAETEVNNASEGFCWPMAGTMGRIDGWQ